MEPICIFVNTFPEMDDVKPTELSRGREDPGNEVEFFMVWEMRFPKWMTSTN